MLFVGDDWAEDHHDVELVDEAGTVLARKRVPEGLAGVTGLHSLIGEYLPDPGDELDPRPRVAADGEGADMADVRTWSRLVGTR